MLGYFDVVVEGIGVGGMGQGGREGRRDIPYLYSKCNLLNI